MKISICICTYNRYEFLQRLLSTLGDLTFDGALHNVEIELFVVDNSPCSRSQALCESMQRDFPIPLHYLVEYERGISQARNFSVKTALEKEADFVAFLDDDDRPSPDWLEQLWAVQKESGADVVCGSWVLSEDLPEWVKKSGIFKSQRASLKKRRTDSWLPRMCSTCNVLISKDIIIKLGEREAVFDPTRGHSGGEDKDFFIRAHALGANLAVAEDSIVFRGHEPVRYSRLGLLRRGFKNGCSRMAKVRNNKGMHESMSQMLSSCTKFVVVLLSLPFCLFWRSLFMHQLYRLGKAAGVIYYYFTGRNYAYYGN
jgi:succinoglycan biosynthesis protein ExoM